MKLILFDMDGTLTDARKKITLSMITALKKLQKADYKIAIVTGSDINYIEQQLDPLFDIGGGVDPTSIVYYPCNGTKKYTFWPSANNKFISDYTNNFSQHVGRNRYSNIIRAIFDCQNYLLRLEGTSELLLTSTFIVSRGSMINWSPIGRNADTIEREAFINADKKYNIRNNVLGYIEKNYSDLFKGVTIKLGGDTSFDIFPVGWNKTFALKECLKEYNNVEHIVFVGDRCGANGNDKEIYDACKKLNNGDSYEVKNYFETINIIDKIIGE